MWWHSPRYNPPGFTDKVLEYLRERRVAVLEEYGIYRATVNSEQLLEIAGMLPPEQFSDRQIKAPTFGDFVEVAKREPEALFDIYIVPSIRPDERVSINGVYLPLENCGLIVQLLDRALDKPDEFDVYKKDGKWYMWLYWY
jgi:hypothetical protein